MSEGSSQGLSSTFPGLMLGVGQEKEGKEKLKSTVGHPGAKQIIRQTDYLSRDGFCNYSSLLLLPVGC